MELAVEVPVEHPVDVVVDDADDEPGDPVVDVQRRDLHLAAGGVRQDEATPQLAHLRVVEVALAARVVVAHHVDGLHLRQHLHDLELGAGDPHLDVVAVGLEPVPRLLDLAAHVPRQELRQLRVVAEVDLRHPQIGGHLGVRQLLREQLRDRVAVGQLLEVQRPGAEVVEHVLDALGEQLRRALGARREAGAGHRAVAHRDHTRGEAVDPVGQQRGGFHATAVALAHQHGLDVPVVVDRRPGLHPAGARHHGHAELGVERAELRHDVADAVEPVEHLDVERCGAAGLDRALDGAHLVVHRGRRHRPGEQVALAVRARETGELGLLLGVPRCPRRRW